MTTPLVDVCCASLPQTALPALAGLRTVGGVRVALVAERAWVRWYAGDDAVLRRVLPICGVELYASRDAHWYRLGRHLPCFDFPATAEYRPLDQVLFPAPVQPVPAPQAPVGPGVPLRLVTDHWPRPTTAVRYDLRELTRWADGVSSVRLAAWEAIIRADRVLLRGARLPLLAHSERFWGASVLLPVGRRAEPELPEDALRSCLAIGRDEVLFWDTDGPEAVPGSLFQPVTRAGLRLACGKGA